MATKEMAGCKTVATTKIVAIIHQDLVRIFNSVTLASGFTIPIIQNRSVAKTKIPKIKLTTIIVSELIMNFHKLNANIIYHFF